jgi:hypothetical protein
LRYLLFLVKAYGLDTSEEAILRNKRQEILDNFAQSKNYNALEWQMRYLESEEKKAGGFGAKRFHKRVYN